MNQNKSVADYTATIFKAKDNFHRTQSKLPIEEKIQILVELQKIVLNIQRNTKSNELKRIWDLK